MPVSPPLPLSVVIIALNEAKRLGDCLDSVRALTDDVVVVDSHSGDGTCAIARARGARVFQRAWSGYSEQKNFGNAQAAHPWILSLDADERVSPELAQSIREEFARGPRCAAYSIRFENYFGRRRIRFGAWNPEWHVRLFDRRKLEWNTDDVHEGLVSVDPVSPGRLGGCIRHLTVDSAAQLVEKTERYSSLFADKMRRRPRPPSWTKVWLNPVWRFTRDYFFRLGAFDGAPGAIIAWEAARYTHLKYARARPPASPIFPYGWRAFAGGLALAALVAVRMPPDTGRDARAENAAVAFGPQEDDDFSIVTIPPDSDDDVLV